MQAQAPQAKDWPVLDLAHLAEEVEDLGISVQHAIESHLERLLLHLLKWRPDPAQEPRRGLRLTIRHARRDIAKYLRRNPGLQYHPTDYLAEAYQAIREDAAIDTDLRLTTFSEAYPWLIEQVLDADFWPEASSMS